MLTFTAHVLNKIDGWSLSVCLSVLRKDEILFYGEDYVANCCVETALWYIGKSLCAYVRTIDMFART